MHPLRPAIGLLRNLSPVALHKPPGLNKLPVGVGMPDFQGLLDSFSALLNMLSSPLQQAFGAPLRSQKVETGQETSTKVAVDLGKPEGPEEVVQEEEFTDDEPPERADEPPTELLPLALEGVPIQEAATAPIAVEDPNQPMVEIAHDPTMPQFTPQTAPVESDDPTLDLTRVHQGPLIQNLTEQTTDEGENARTFTPHDTSVTALMGERPELPVEEPVDPNLVAQAPAPSDSAEDSASTQTPSTTTTTLEQLEELLGTRVEVDPEPVEDMPTESGRTPRPTLFDVFAKAPEVPVVQAQQVEQAPTAKHDAAPRAEAISGNKNDKPESVSKTREAREARQSRQLDFIDRIVRAARLSRGNSVSRLKLTLDPPNLGSLKADLSVKDGVLKASLEAPSAAVHDMILSHVRDLKQALESAGIQVGDLQVSVREHGQHGARQDGQGHHEGFASNSFDRPGVLTQQGTERIPLRPMLYQMLDVVA